MLFLRSCCKQEALEDRCFVQQRLVWRRFSSLIRMICMQRLCDTAGKFPHITLPLTEQFDLCGYYNSAQLDKHIIGAERKGMCLNVRHLLANVLYRFGTFWAVDWASHCSASSLVSAQMHELLSCIFIRLPEPEAEICPLSNSKPFSVHVNLHKDLICGSTCSLGLCFVRPLHNAACHQTWIKPNDRPALHKCSLQGHLHHLRFKGDLKRWL